MVAGVCRLEIEPVIGHNQWELKKKKTFRTNYENPPVVKQTQNERK